MARGQPIKVRGFISIEGAPPVPMESLTKEQVARVQQVWKQRLSKNMSAYYTQHPEELRAI